MKILKTLVAAAGLVLAAACSDTSNQVTGINPAFSKAGKGGFGDPHFTTDMVCTFNTETGRLACDYQIAGLSALSSGEIGLIGSLGVRYFCDYPGTTRDYHSTTVGLEVEGTYYADKKGTAKGELEAAPAYLSFCLPKYIIGTGWVTPSPSEVEFTPLDEQAVPAHELLSLDTGEWALFALVSTPKGGLHYINFEGSWVPELVLE